MIYSPDLVATEREYLVAKQNQQRVAGSTVPGAPAVEGLPIIRDNSSATGWGYKYNVTGCSFHLLR